jgi:DNA-binding protein H-NS
MAKQTYAQLQEQIASLNLQAQQLRNDEISDVVARIKEAIKAYDILPAHLFGSRGASTTKPMPASPVKSKSKSKSKAPNATAKFADGQGGEWVGRGPRPKWLRDAIGQGRSLAEFAVGAGTPVAAEASAPAVGPRAVELRRSSKATTKKAAAAKSGGFSDGAGKHWSGRGPKPGWLKDALAAGRAIDELRS